MYPPDKCPLAPSVSQCHDERGEGGMIGDLVNAWPNSGLEPHRQPPSNCWGNTCSSDTSGRYVAATLTMLTSNYLTFGGSDSPGSTADQVHPYPHHSTMGGKRFRGL